MSLEHQSEDELFNSTCTNDIFNIEFMEQCNNIKSPLHFAAAMGKLNFVQYLVENRNYNPESIDPERKKRPIHLACENGNMDVIRYLIKVQNCNLKVLDNNNNTPLETATLCGQVEVVKYLVENMKCSPQSKGFEGSVLLHLAAKGGHLNVMKYLIEVHSCDFKINNDDTDTPLDLAAREGHLKVVNYLIEEKGCSPESKGFNGMRLIHFAATGGHLSVIKYLIEVHSSNFEAQDDSGDTPLQLAAGRGHVEVVKYLIEEKGCSPESKGFNGMGLIHFAAEGGHLSVIKYLIEAHSSNFEAQDEYRSTLPHSVAWEGHLEVVKYLIENKGCSPESKNLLGMGLIHCAAAQGHLSVIKYLIEVHSSNFEAQDDSGDTPLQLAAGRGHVEVVKYLIEEKGCSPKSKGFNGMGLIHFAAEGGHLSVIKYLIEAHSSNFEAQDEYRSTLPHSVAWEGHLEVVKYLIENKGCSPESKNLLGMGLIHCAAAQGHLSVIKYLIEVHSSNFEAQDDSGDTPLQLAAGRGHVEVVKYLIEEKGCSPESKGFNGRRLIHFAAEGGHLSVIKYLIEVHSSNFEAQDEHRSTLPHSVAWEEDLEVAKYLIENKGCSPESKNLLGMGLIHCAAAQGHLSVIKYLIEVPSSNFKAQNDSVDTPLQLAAGRGHVEVVKYLIEEKGCSPKSKGFNGMRLIHFAAEGGHLSVIKYLIEFHSSNFKARDNDRNTPLLIAALNGHLEVVKYLIEEKGCSPERKGFNGIGLIHFAATGGHLSVIKYLIEVHSSNFKARDNDRNTPLHIAAFKGHLEVVKYLIEDKGCSPESKILFRMGLIHCAAIGGCLSVIKYLIEVHSSNFEVHDDNKITPLHYAANKGHLEVVKYLIEEKGCSSEIKSYKNQTLIHSAAGGGHLSIMKYLIEVHSSNFEAQDDDGCTPLHLAALLGHLEVVKYLIEDKGCSLESEGLVGRELIRCAAEGRYFSACVSSYFRRLISTELIEQKYLLSLNFSIMVLGNSGAGKSTLVKAVTTATSFKNHFFPIEAVSPYTTGVIPHTFTSKTLGSVKFYDFAGHEEYHVSHDIILRHNKHSLILLLFNISLSISRIKEQILYWISILLNANSVTNLNVMLVASHADQGHYKQNSREADEYMKTLPLMNKFRIKYHGLISCDCRYAVSSQMTKLKSKIVCIRKEIVLEHIKSEDKGINRYCAYLMYHLKHYEASLPPTMKLSTLLYKLQNSDSSEPLLSELVDIKKLHQTCVSLSAAGHIVYLQHDSVMKESLIILEEAKIFGQVHSLLKDIVATMDNDLGVLGECELLVILAQLKDLPMEPEIALKYLLFTQMCTSISQEFLSMKSRQVFPSPTYYLFPNLVKSKCPDNVFMKDTEHTNISTWMIKCSPNQLFAPHCIHSLFIELVKTTSRGKNTIHKMWKNGILLVNGDTVRSVIEFTDQTTRLKVMMQCHKDHMLDLVQYRSELLTFIRSLVQRVTSDGALTEVLLTSQAYPITDWNEIPVKEIANCMIQRKAGVPIFYLHSNARSLKCFRFCELLYFDSFHAVGSSVYFRDLLLNKTSKELIPGDILAEIKGYLGGNHKLVTELKKVEAIEQGITYSNLHEVLLQYSILSKEIIEEVLCSQNIIPLETNQQTFLQYFEDKSLDLTDTYAICVGLIYTLDKWKEFGQALGVPPCSLSVIERDYCNDSKHCLVESVAAWLKGEGSPATWKEAVKAAMSLSKSRKHHMFLTPHCLTDCLDTSDQFLEVSIQQLESNDHLKEIMTYLIGLNHKWFLIGLSLGVHYNSLKDIEAASKLPERRLANTIARWLQDGHVHGGGVASWRSLATALNGPLVKEHQVAARIKEEHSISN